MFQYMSALGSLLSGASSVGSMFGSSSPGISWGDVNKNLAYNKGLMALQRPHLRFQRRLQRGQAKFASKNFGRYAKNMGVSRYALLGNAPSGMVSAQMAPTGQTAPTEPGVSTADKFRGLGQDIQRGVNSMVSIEGLKSKIKVDDAHAELMQAQAAKLRNQTQTENKGITEENIKPVQLHRGAGLQHKYKTSLVQPVIHSGVVRHMPKQEYSDFLSEDAPSRVLFWKDRVNYAQRMNAGHMNKNRRARQQFIDEKDRLEWKLKTRLRWVPSFQYRSRWFGNKQVTGAWVTSDYK